MRTDPTASCAPPNRKAAAVKINIMGPGNMGRAIATRALAGGHGVCLVHPDADPARALAEELKQRFPDSESDWAASAKAADVTVLTLW
jgi:pyrroline-5-carboxylate reductase